MAIVEFGGGITNITGSIAGWTFQRNRAGAIIRRKPQQSKSATIKQVQQQADFVAFIQAFQELSPGDKLAWDAFAISNSKENSFGQERILTGQNWFTTINSARARLGLAQLDVPAGNDLPESITGFNLVVDAVKIEISSITPNNPTDTGLFIETSFPIAALSKLQRSPLRKTETIASGPFGTIDLTSAWEATHKMSWPPGGVANCFSIGVRIQPVRSSTGITSEGIALVSGLDFAGSGIDFMEIGSTFIVT